jgi:uncharacterized membrane protein YgdD (TMEM256/DUF423 family)
MRDSRRTIIAACTGFFAVALGAFGAHGLKATLASHDTAATWATASHYHLVHAVVLLVLALHGTEGCGVVWRRAWCVLLAGIIVFSGSLYVLSVTGFKWLGAITPIGGVLLLAGWAMLALGARARKIG